MFQKPSLRERRGLPPLPKLPTAEELSKMPQKPYPQAPPAPAPGQKKPDLTELLLKDIEERRLKHKMEIVEAVKEKVKQKMSTSNLKKGKPNRPKPKMVYFTGEKKHKCKYCNMVFFSKFNSKRHERKIHPKQWEAAKNLQTALDLNKYTEFEELEGHKHPMQLKQQKKEQQKKDQQKKEQKKGDQVKTVTVGTQTEMPRFPIHTATSNSYQFSDKVHCMIWRTFK